jgi:hypothetical protein
MLDGELSIEAYLQTQDLEYPQFTRMMARVLRKLYHNGHSIYQIEPFLANLLKIHERLAAGGRPSDLRVGSKLHAVYEAERKATATLINFYEASSNGDFEDTLLAVKRFAYADARRFKLRDRMRADAIAEKIVGGGSYYIEAGMMHYPIWLVLKRRLPSKYKIKLEFPLRRAVRAAGIKGRLYGPGDVLTLHYIFREHTDEEVIDLLAARALVFNKLIAKQEFTENPEIFPHTRNEIDIDQIVRRLTLADCRRLFPVVRKASSEVAKDMVSHYMTANKS